LIPAFPRGGLAAVRSREFEFFTEESATSYQFRSRHDARDLRECDQPRFRLWPQAPGKEVARDE
jgi:hypothetical protein